MSGLRTDILTSTGNYFDFADLENNVIDIQDIAQGLSNVCRFAGQCPDCFYSVAEHSVLVMKLLKHEGVRDKVVLLQGLLHDASESLMGDMTTPLKRMMPQFRELEDRLQAMIMRRFGLPETLPDVVKRCDLMALAIEKRDIMNSRDAWAVLVDIPIVNVAGLDALAMSPRVAKQHFLGNYEILTT